MSEAEVRSIVKIHAVVWLLKYACKKVLTRYKDVSGQNNCSHLSICQEFKTSADTPTLWSLTACMVPLCLYFFAGTRSGKGTLHLHNLFFLFFLQSTSLFSFSLSSVRC